MAEIGLMFPQMRMDFAAMEERVCTAEEAGLASIWLMDHMGPPAAWDQPSFEAWTTATWLAARTSSIRIGHLVLCDAFRHPALLAKMATTLDHASNGRLDLGIGWGSVPAEIKAWGYTDAGAVARSRRLAESLAVMRALWESGGEPVNHHGELFDLRDVVQVPAPVQSPLPVLIGGGGETLTLPLVERWAQWWNCPAYSADRLEPMIARLKSARPDLRISLQIPIGLARTAAQVDEVRALTERRFGFWGQWAAGTPDDVATRLAGLADLGVDLFIVQLHDFATADSIALLAGAVAPAVR